MSLKGTSNARNKQIKILAHFQEKKRKLRVPYISITPTQRHGASYGHNCVHSPDPHAGTNCENCRL